MAGRRVDIFPGFFKRCLRAGVRGLLTVSFWVPAAAGVSRAGEIPDPFPGAAASYLLQANGKTLWASAPDRRLPPASLTKVMTALLVLERGRLEGAATISEAAAQETGTRLGLRAGERMPVDSLLSAALLGSANDACRALAEHLAGSETAFVSLMNRRAGELGLKNTRFHNARGFDHPRHYSTARDLAALTEAALKNPLFSERVGRIHASVATLGGRSFLIENKNEIVGRYPGAVGVKTGYTSKAGKCLIALAEREGTRVLLVLLNAPDRWWTAEAMLDRAFLSPRSAGVKP